MLNYQALPGVVSHFPHGTKQRKTRVREEDDTRCSRVLAYFASYNLPEENGELLLV